MDTAIVCHNIQFLSPFKDITPFVGIYEYKSKLKHVDINFNE